ncbi:MAG: RluA family pseudouridine synthase [Oscillospiraceae bacterium]
MLEFVVTEEYDGRRLFVFLRGQGVSASQIRSVKYDEDGISVNGKRAKTNQIVRKNDSVAVKHPESSTVLVPCADIVPIVYESDEAIVFDKPAGMATHPTRNQPEGTLANVFARIMLQRGVGATFRPVNRLDKNTSGLVLVAKTRFATEKLLKSARKKYAAVAEGTFEAKEETVNMPIARCGDSIIKRCVSENGDRSVTHFAVVGEGGGHSLLEVEIFTGRTHQIRVHMSWLCHPLAGDSLYGGSDRLIARQALHCKELSFTEPISKKEIALKSPMPRDMEALIKSLDISDK